MMSVGAFRKAMDKAYMFGFKEKPKFELEFFIDSIVEKH